MMTKRRGARPSWAKGRLDNVSKYFCCRGDRGDARLGPVFGASTGSSVECGMCVREMAVGDSLPVCWRSVDVRIPPSVRGVKRWGGGSWWGRGAGRGEGFQRMVGLLCVVARVQSGNQENFMLKTIQASCPVRYRYVQLSETTHRQTGTAAPPSGMP
jgi:hypothetical protein